jgi:hypothetical protein
MISILIARASAAMLGFRLVRSMPDDEYLPLSVDLVISVTGFDSLQCDISIN